ncbi:hypothetical protein YC2023_118499 [Brassica napus]
MFRLVQNFYVKSPCSFTQREIEYLTDTIHNGGTEVMSLDPMFHLLEDIWRVNPTTSDVDYHRSSQAYTVANLSNQAEEEQTHTSNLKSHKTYGVACIEVLSKDYFHVYLKELEEILNSGFTNNSLSLMIFF